MFSDQQGEASWGEATCRSRGMLVGGGGVRGAWDVSAGSWSAVLWFGCSDAAARKRSLLDHIRWIVLASEDHILGELLAKEGDTASDGLENAVTCGAPC